MTVHLFGGLGMMPFGITTDPGLPNFMQRAKSMIPGLVLHGPYRDYDTGQIAAIVDELPASDVVFVAMTSLSANDGFVVSSYLKKRKLDGLFMFQASMFGFHSTGNLGVKFAHLIYSYTWIPVPGIGAYVPPEGPLTVENYVRTNRNDPHPGDGVLANQLLFIDDMRRIVNAATAPGVAQPITGTDAEQHAREVASGNVT